MKNIIKHNFDVNFEDRIKLLTQKPILIWFTGLSGSGKSTISNALEKKLHENMFKTYSLDGDNIRHGLCNNLTFTVEDRNENIRRIGEVSKILLESGIIVCASFISPFRKNRDDIKKIVGEEYFFEIYVNTSLEECERRDVKGLYKKARNGDIKNFTGISSHYEEPIQPDIEVQTEKFSIEEIVNKIYEKIINKITYKLNP